MAWGLSKHHYGQHIVFCNPKKVQLIGKLVNFSKWKSWCYIFPSYLKRITFFTKILRLINIFSNGAISYCAIFFYFESAEQHPTLHLLDISSTYILTYLLGFKVFQLRAIILHSHHLSWRKSSFFNIPGSPPSTKLFKNNFEQSSSELNNRRV